MDPLTHRHDNHHPEPASNEPPLVKTGQGAYEREYRPTPRVRPSRLLAAAAWAISALDSLAFMPGCDGDTKHE